MSHYLLPKQHCIDLYDLFTIKECLDWYWSMRKGMEKHRDEFKDESDEKFNQEVHKCCSYAVNVLKGEKYRHKNETIQKWMDRDEKTQRIFDEACTALIYLCI